MFLSSILMLVEIICTILTGVSICIIMYPNKAVNMLSDFLYYILPDPEPEPEPSPPCYLCDENEGLANFCNGCMKNICLGCFKQYRETWYTMRRLEIFGCPWCNRVIESDHPVYNLCTNEEKDRWNTTTQDVSEIVPKSVLKSIRTKLSNFRIKMTTTKCPGCHIRVNKIDGCNHISCLCGTEFCYRCGKRGDADHECKKLFAARSA